MNVFVVALRNLSRRRIRSFTTIAGISLAVATLVSLLGVAREFRLSFLQLMEQQDIDLVVFKKSDRQSLDNVIDESLADSIKTIEAIEQVTPTLAEITSMEGANMFGVPVTGWPANSKQIVGKSLVKGRSLGVDDSNGVMIGQTLAKQLQKNVGDTIEVEVEDFQVIGIFESSNIYENGSVVMLLKSLQELVDRKGSVSGFSVKLKEGQRSAKMAEQVSQSIVELKRADGKSMGLDAMPTSEFVNSSSSFKVANGIALLTSSIALLISTLGLMNTMTMSVFERTSDIGIIRAVGWSKSRVIRLILVESFLLSAFGSIAGCLLAAALVFGMSCLSPFQALVTGSISWPVIMLGLLVGPVISVISGFYPAIRASRMSPVAALRHL